MKTCYWVSSTSPRMLIDQHAAKCDDSQCRGCRECEARHCVMTGCPGRHLRAATDLHCSGCLGLIRNELRQIEVAQSALYSEALACGIDSTAFAMIGPVADPGALYRKGEAVDELQHPLSILGEWEDRWRIQLDCQTSGVLTLGGAIRFCRWVLDVHPQAGTLGLDAFAGDVRGVIRRLEAVLGDLDERPLPCECGGRLRLKWEPGRGVEYASDAESLHRAYDDAWCCGECGIRIPKVDMETRRAARVERAYVPAERVAEELGVSRALVKQWASRGQVRKKRGEWCGPDGWRPRTLYRLADARMLAEERAGHVLSLSEGAPMP